MTINKIFKLLKIAARNEAECYSNAFAARTNAERTTYALEADKWGNEWLRLSRTVGRLVDKK